MGLPGTAILSILFVELTGAPATVPVAMANAINPNAAQRNPKLPIMRHHLP
jgi:hypothetical protein